MPPLTETLLIQPVLNPQGAAVTDAVPITGNGLTVTVPTAEAVQVPFVPISV